MRILVICWCIVGFSFNTFFNIDFRTSLLTQKFPPDIDTEADFDITKDGLFFHRLYHKGTVDIDISQSNRD